MSLRFTLLSASLVFATACSSSADSADKTSAAKASSSTPIATPAAPAATASAPAAAPIVLAQATPAATPAAAAAPAAAPAAGGALYTVVDKNKVDPNTLMGWKTWRAQACERCHGASQEGLVGPSLVNSLKVLTKDEFKTTLKNGRVEKGMPNFGGVPGVVNNLDNLYAYLKGRSDGAIAAGHLYPIEK